MSDGKTQKLSRALVALSAEPAVERCPDKRARASRSEQRQRRSELYGIDIAEHRHRVTADQILERRHAFDLARAIVVAVGGEDHRPALPERSCPGAEAGDGVPDRESPSL